MSSFMVVSYGVGGGGGGGGGDQPRDLVCGARAAEVVGWEGGSGGG